MNYGSLAALTAAPFLISLMQDSSAPSEFGDVQWSSDLGAAQVAAEASKKPIMLLFQEVPG